MISNNSYIFHNLEFLILKIIRNLIDLTTEDDSTPSSWLSDSNNELKVISTTSSFLSSLEIHERDFSNRSMFFKKLF